MTKDEVIIWCRKYLPKWPTTGNLNELARPPGWYWRTTLTTGDSLVLSSTPGNHVYEKDVFPVVQAPPPAPVLVASAVPLLPISKPDAIEWCKDNIKQWPKIGHKGVLLTPCGWGWYLTRFPYQVSSEYTLYTSSGLPPDLGIRETDVFPSKKHPKDIVRFLEKIDKLKACKSDKRKTMVVSHENFKMLIDYFGSSKFLPLYTYYVYDGITIKPMDYNRLLIIEFILDNNDIFEKFLIDKGRSDDDVLDSLIYDT